MLGMPQDVCHSLSESKPWFKAILRTPVIVDRVVIVNRMDDTVCVIRLNGAEVSTRVSTI